MVKEIVARILGRNEETALPVAVARAAPSGKTAGQFAAVTIVPGAPCCGAAAELRGRAMLVVKHTRLPLSDCATPESCKCRFQKQADRREGDERRLAGLLHMNAWYAGTEKRLKQGRRPSDR